MPPVIINPPLMPMKNYNKFNQGNFQKIDIESETKISVKNLRSPVVVLNNLFLRYLEHS